MLKLTVCGQSIAGEYSPAASDSIDYLRAYFSFSPDWNGLVKTAQFSQSGTVYNSIIENDCCAVPNELRDGKIIISVFGQESGKAKRITTLPFEMTIRKSGFSSDSQYPIPPTPDLYSQFISKVEKAIQPVKLPLDCGTGAASLAGGAVIPENVTGEASFAYGAADNEVSSPHSAAFGRHSKVSGNNGFAAGSDCTVSGAYGTAFGEGNSVTVKGGAAFGTGSNAAETENQFVCGRYNCKTKGLFIVGKGNSFSDCSNAVVVKENGDAEFSGKVAAAEPTQSNQLATKRYVDDNTPTKVSQLENDAGYAKASEIPKLSLAAGKGENSLAGGEVPPKNVEGRRSIAVGTEDNKINILSCQSAAFGTHNEIGCSPADYGSASVNASESFAAGSWNAVLAQYGIALGEGNHVRVKSGVAVGDHNRAANTPGQFVCGRNNAETSGLFVVGKGSSMSNRSNAFVIKENGDATLSGKLTVNAPTAGTHAATKAYVDSRYVSVTQSEYNALSVKDPNTFYFVEAD